MRYGCVGVMECGNDGATNHQPSIINHLLTLLLFLTPLNHPSLHAEPAPKKDETTESAPKKSKTDLSSAATREVGRYMNLVLEDPQNQFAFDRVYEIYESEKKTWKLLEFFQNAARLDRKSGNLQFLLGMMYIRFRDYYKSAEHFQKGLKLIPKSYFGRQMLGRIYLKRSDAIKASEYLADAVNAASSHAEQVEALFLLGDALMLAERGEEAKKAWARIQDLQQFDVPTLQRLARAYRTHEYTELADGMLHKILELAEKDPRLKSHTYLRRARLQEGIGDKAKAIQYLQESRKLLLPNSARRREIEDQIRRLHAEDERLVDFFGELESEVQRRPNDVALRKEIARHYSAAEQIDKASVHLSKGIEIDSRDVLLLEHAARVYRTQQKTDVSAETLNRLYDITGGAPNYLIERGDILWEKGQKEDAMAAWKKVVEDDPDNPSRYQNVIRAYRQQKLSEEALALYKDLLSLLSRKLDSQKTDTPDSEGEEAPLGLTELYEETKLSLANYLLSLDRKDEAKEHLTELTSDEQAPASLYLQVGELYENFDMTDELSEVLDKGLTQFENDSRLAKQKGFALESQQKYDEAIKMFFRSYD
ncbi:MAG: tetratricopeptide repeat protein, partial [Planctomycetota bacterium]|nr:tetratricopeptide repeat protein [Planctomycetota bacterium]